jgi:hypothetical protein
MSDFDAQGFVAPVERLGLLLTAVRLADGNVRLNRWRMPDAVIHAQRIEALWAAQIAENPDRVQQLGAHVMQRVAERSPPSVPSTRVRRTYGCQPGANHGLAAPSVMITFS